MFHYQTAFSLRDEQLYTEWIKNIFELHKRKGGMLNFIFVSDEALLEMNREYLHHDYFTDIISFGYPEYPGISGDIFISVDRVKDNAEKFGTDFLEEMRRVMCHGVLHLIGFKDKSPSESEEMRRMEDRGLKWCHGKQS